MTSDRGLTEQHLQETYESAERLLGEARERLSIVDSDPDQRSATWRERKAAADEAVRKCQDAVTEARTAWLNFVPT